MPEVLEPRLGEVRYADENIVNVYVYVCVFLAKTHDIHTLTMGMGWWFLAMAILGCAVWADKCETNISSPRARSLSVCLSVCLDVSLSLSQRKKTWQLV